MYDPLYTSVQTGVLESIDNNNINFLIVSGLSTPPNAGDIIGFTDYDDQNDSQKLLHGSFTPSVPIVSGISDTQFTVSDGSIFFIGAFIDIRNADYSVFVRDLTVTNVAGNTITVGPTIGLTPDSSYTVEGIGFATDEGQQYLLY